MIIEQRGMVATMEAARCPDVDSTEEGGAQLVFHDLKGNIITVRMAADDAAQLHDSLLALDIQESGDFGDGPQDQGGWS